MEKEIYKWVPGFEGHYKISNFVNVLSFKRNKNGELLKLGKDTRGYYSFIACLKGKKRTLYPHVLICTLFVGDKPSKNHVPDHIDENPLNNCYWNLQWLTYGENTAKSRPAGFKFSSSKRPVVQKDLNGEIVAIHPSLSSAARVIDPTTALNGIKYACQKKLKTYKGFIWDFAEDGANHEK
ncbi:NUMOD4 motif-containing HNH endonuclease [Bacillus sp. FJAT-29814]|uniref:NUMOD4 motif-containing HNH endonuclease n=1 Tax=Bacillus sp. FJAT-29814 TaxID=1729688 RepID=UPI00082F96A4|nr:NUMOD4 motif-containing HNH endonuclease [Bacillus sp. FJAT-29814]